MLLLALCLVLVAGCARPGKQPVVTKIEDDGFDPFDPERMPEEKYRIRRGDGISVRFLYNAELDVTNIIVRDDGMVTLPVIGDVMAADNTPVQLEDLIKDGYQKYSEETGYGKVIRAGDEIQIRFVYNPHLNQRLIVRPDGFVSLLKLGEVKADGVNFVEFESSLKKGYQKYIRNPEMAVYMLFSRTRKIYSGEGEISVLVTAPQPKQVFVGGEVGEPKLIEFRDWLTPWQAINHAGGLRLGADAGRVIYISRSENDNALITKIDLQRYLKRDTEVQNLYLRHGDVLLVPRTGIAKLNLFVEQYIRKVVPFNTGISFSYLLDRDAELFR